MNTDIPFYDYVTDKPCELTREVLLSDLYVAFYNARQRKSKKRYVRRFERDLDVNLNVLCDELLNHTYRPQPSTCFIVKEPKKREVFCAQFRDRVVHHLFYNYTHEKFERYFLHDTYSCIPGRGTHMGVNRLNDHIRRESHNYQRECYVLKLDIRGYFMHVDRHLLLQETHRLIDRAFRKDDPLRPFLLWLSEEIIMLDPTEGCIIKGDPKDWEGLPDSKRLDKSPEGCGLPIGNLTSQLFSNIYLNVFDQWMKREVHCRHYGRYVDDAYAVSCDRKYLAGLIPEARQFLKERLHLQLHEGKTQICHVNHGVEFLGVFLKPHRRYTSRRTLGRMAERVSMKPPRDITRWMQGMQSRCSILRQTRSFKIRERIFLTGRI